MGAFLTFHRIGSDFKVCYDLDATWSDPTSQAFYSVDYDRDFSAGVCDFVDILLLRSLDFHNVILVLFDEHNNILMGLNSNKL